MSISDRATKAIQPKDMTIDLGSLDHLREAWRFKAMAWSEAVERADRLEERRKALFAEICLQFMAGPTPMPATKAEKEARVSRAFQECADDMHAAKRAARDLDIEKQLAQVAYYELKQQIDVAREERRMTR